MKLELLVAALIDLDAMDGKGSVSLLAECSSSPDASTRYYRFYFVKIHPHPLLFFMDKLTHKSVIKVRKIGQ